MILPVAFLIGAYFFGSVPYGFLIARWHGFDIRAKGSGNIGATNVGRLLGRKSLLIKSLQGYKITTFPAVNTLYNAMKHADPITKALTSGTSNVSRAARPACRRSRSA